MAPGMMDAVVFKARCQVAVERVPMPQIEEPGDVIVRIELAGLCGSDLHPFHCRELTDEGTIMGHELVGRVVQIGPSVSKFGVGDRVMSPFTTCCGACFYCMAALPCRCLKGQLLGFLEDGRGLQGAQAQFIRVPLADGTLVAVPDDVSDEEALLLGDIFSTGFFCAHNAGIGGPSALPTLLAKAAAAVAARAESAGDDPRMNGINALARGSNEEAESSGAQAAGSAAKVGESGSGAAGKSMSRAEGVSGSSAAGGGGGNAGGGAHRGQQAHHGQQDPHGQQAQHGEQQQVVAVVGCGPVGLFAVMAARALGASAVFAIDSLPDRLAAAEKLGARPVDRQQQDPVHALRAATGGRGADIVLEVVGAPSALRLAYDLVRPGGTISAVGCHTDPSFPFTPAEAYNKNLTLKAGRCPARWYMEKLLPLVQSKQVDIAAVISHRMPLREAVQAYEMFDAKRDGCTKVVLRPWE